MAHLQAAAVDGLSGWSLARVVFWVLVFVAFLGGAPLVAWLLQRRGSVAGPGHGVPGPPDGGAER